MRTYAAPWRPILAVSLALCALWLIVSTWAWPFVGDASYVHYCVFLIQRGLHPCRDIVDVTLPGAYLASVFSMTFFNFQNSGTAVVSNQFWIYWAVDIPVTILIVGVWYVWEKMREARYNREDEDLEKGSEHMEKDIMAAMRKRTMSKASTWDTKKME